MHHIFGGATCELVAAAYRDAYLTAHFEVPGEMFDLAMKAKARGMGVVGSTQNILDFIAAKVSAQTDLTAGATIMKAAAAAAALTPSLTEEKGEESEKSRLRGKWEQQRQPTSTTRPLTNRSNDAPTFAPPLTHTRRMLSAHAPPRPRSRPQVSDALGRPHGDALQFVLGTESGMITSIVRRVQGQLAAAGRRDVSVEIVFPVAPEAITTPAQTTSTSTTTTVMTTATAATTSNSSSASTSGGGGGGVQLPGGLAVLPGAASGEGCSLEGGCASCPYMKMNSLDALLRVVQRVGDPAAAPFLEPYKPQTYAADARVGGKSLAQAGCVPILHMRHFQTNKALSDELVADVLTRHTGGGGGR